MSAKGNLLRAGVITNGTTFYIKPKSCFVVSGKNPKLNSNDWEVMSQGIYDTSATQKYALGTMLFYGDRIFRYTLMGGSAGVAGTMYQSPADGGPTTLQEDLNIETASAAGDDFGYATIATDTLVADDFKDGYYTVSDGSAAQGAGQTYQIESHPAGSGSVKFTFYDKIAKLISVTGTSASLIHHPRRLVIQGAGPLTGMPVGVPLWAATASQYCWLQTRGVCGVLAAGDIAAGMSVVCSASVAGAVTEQLAGTNSLDDNVVGHSIAAGDNTDFVLIYLTLD